MQRRALPSTNRALTAGVMFEPGVYIPGAFGVRLEDAARVTPAGAQVLTRHDMALP